MDMQLQGKKALITGSTYGIGYAIAESLAMEGVDVVITGRHQETVTSAIKKIKGINCKTNPIGISADCSTLEGCQSVFDTVPKVDILINNLGIYERKSFFEINDTDWARLFEINVLSGIRFTRFYTPKMVSQEWGRIIFISSESGLMIPPDMIHYGFSKSAQLSISRGLAMSLSGTGVTVNALLPGPTRTETTEQQRRDRANEWGISLEQLEQEFFNKVRPTSIIKRFAEAKEVAPLAVYLCSPLSALTTGAALRVDGGIVNQIT
ncbi:MAG: SDR family NAD(P)-dependent oxidoreductase [Proteobacteria bacterium]|nr:SDR family NAD(P)-dependent oxidoreductase [Pseudomonadota bacterium]MDA1330960.1 SDR family NAD(P)-dependent oxidoreductase [Pseudomonadota bacterium]